MSQPVTIEERLSHLEQEVAELKKHLGDEKPTSWLDQITGSFKDDPEFEEVLRLGAEIRRSEVEDDPS